MADPAPNGPRNWLWLLVIALLAVLLLIWFLNPSGNEDAPGVQDPIVTGDLTDPAANEPPPPLGAEPGTALDTPAAQPATAPEPTPTP